MDPIPEHRQHEGAISFPYITRTGVVSIRFRQPGEGYKPISLHGDTARIYNATALTSDTVWICEGEFDTITARICGLHAVGFPGANSWKPVFRPAFRYRRAVVLAHGDEAGKNFYASISEYLNSCAMIKFPDGEDVNSYYVKYGRDKLREFIGVD